jgi:Fe-S oxidoreductase
MMGIWSGFLRERNQENLDHRSLNQTASPYSYIPPAGKVGRAGVLYFAGCMSHLTPGITRAMEAILEESGDDYNFIDRDGSICCGRPLMLAGRDREARELIRRNTEIIWKSGATTLVTSCPICFKIFRESYHLDIEILHHSQYINRLIEEKQIRLNFLNNSVVYHDPCELGRGSGVYDEPREVLVHVARLGNGSPEREDALCCGGSLGNLKLDRRKASGITKEAFKQLTVSSPDYLATACPLCKKSFGSNAAGSETEVLDIAEIVTMAMVRGENELVDMAQIEVPEHESVLS